MYFRSMIVNEKDHLEKWNRMPHYKYALLFANKYILILKSEDEK